MIIDYRDNPPEFYKDLTSNGILAYFEDERVTPDELAWVKEILSSEDFKLRNNPISKWNWNKIKSNFATKFFPDIAPATREKTVSTEDRINILLSR